MNRRFPLYARILLWFFLNLLLLGGSFALFVRMQLRGGVDSMLAGQAGERLRAIGQVIVEELHERPRAEWNGILNRIGKAYQTEFFLFENEGSQLAGAPLVLPTEVMARLRGGPGQPRLPPSGPEREPRGVGDRGPEDRRPPPHAPRLVRDGLEPGRRPPTVRDTFLARSEEPRYHWIGLRFAVPGPGPRPLVPATLLVRTPTLIGGGLFFDVEPWLIAGGVALVVSALFWFPLVRGITRSIRQMTAASTQMAEGQFEVRVEAGRRDELGMLADALNQMAARLGGFVTGQKRFLGDIAHELCAPLARLQMALGILEQRADTRQLPYVADLREELQHMSSLVNELLSFSKAGMRPRDLQLEPVDLAALARRVVEREAAAAVVVEIEIPEETRALAEPELLSRALANLLRNAARYAGNAGPIRIKAHPRGDRIVLAVLDQGPGVPPEALQQIFDPFFRVEASRSRDTGGVGLGLAIVKTCVEACGGTVSAKNRVPIGLEVELVLPGVPAVAD